MFALASWLTNTQAGEGFGPGSLVEPARLEVKRARLVFGTRGVFSPGTATQSFLDATNRLA